MSTPTHPTITRLGGHSANNAHQAGAANTQPTGDQSPMETTPTAPAVSQPSWKDTSTMNTDTEQAIALATGLRNLAAMIVEHPHLAPVVHRAVDMMASVGHGDEQARDLIVAAAKAALASGATVIDDDTGAGVHVAFGPVRIQVYAAAEKVHHVTRRTVEQTDDGTTCRITEYTPRSILTEIQEHAA